MVQTNCYICKSDSYTSFASILNDSYGETFSIVECDCGFSYLNPRPKPEEMEKYYNTVDYHPHSKGNGFVYSLYKIVQKITFRGKYKTLKKYTTTDIKHLDYGGGDGKFSKYLNLYNSVSSTSYDPYFNGSDSPDLKNNSFNVITLWHVLEHAYDLDLLFENLERMLSDSGKLFIAVPNINAIERKYFDTNWAAYDLPRHLYHFSSDSLDRLLENKKYRIINKKRMLFDSFYISILSSKKGSTIAFIKSILLSILISIRVLLQGPNYSSSLFYVCEKKN